VNASDYLLAAILVVRVAYFLSGFAVGAGLTLLASSLVIVQMRGSRRAGLP
jgi:hypothetical protein